MVDEDGTVHPTLILPAVFTGNRSCHKTQRRNWRTNFAGQRGAGRPSCAALAGLPTACLLRGPTTVATASWATSATAGRPLQSRERTGTPTWLTTTGSSALARTAASFASPLSNKCSQALCRHSLAQLRASMRSALFSFAGQHHTRLVDCVVC